MANSNTNTILKVIGVIALVGFLIWIFGKKKNGNGSSTNGTGTTGGSGTGTGTGTAGRTTGRIINFNYNNIGLTASTERKPISSPVQNPYGYSLCYTRLATLNMGSEDLSVWQAMVTNTFQDIRNQIQKARNDGHQIAIIINAPKIVPGASVEFYVYAGNCKSQIATEVINYIQNLH